MILFYYVHGQETDAIDIYVTPGRSAETVRRVSKLGEASVGNDSR